MRSGGGGNQLLDTIEFVFCLMSEPCVRLTPLSVKQKTVSVPNFVLTLCFHFVKLTPPKSPLQRHRIQFSSCIGTRRRRSTRTRTTTSSAATETTTRTFVLVMLGINKCAHGNRNRPSGCTSPTLVSGSPRQRTVNNVVVLQSGPR